MSMTVAFGKKVWFARAAMIAAGLLLVPGYAPFADAGAGWIALIPLLLAVPFLSRRDNFLFAWFGGSLFYLFTLSWLLRLGVTGAPWPLAVLGWLLLALYCGLYWGLFAWLWSFAWTSDCSLLRVFLRSAADAANRSAEDEEEIRRVTDPTLLTIFRMLLAVVLWTGLEYLRGTLLTGFPWNLLGVTQYRNIAIIQVAALGGVYAVSAVVMLLNAGLALTARRLCQAGLGGAGRRRFHAELMITLIICAVAWIRGADYARRTPARGEGELRSIAVVQPNIQQRRKWDDADSARILDDLEKYTGLAALMRPALIVWPETAVPAALPDPAVQTWLADAFDLEIPLLVGALEWGAFREGERQYLYNSSFLLDKHGDIIATYRKQHLVPFVEYIPLERIFPVLGNLSPLGFSCRPGEDVVTLQLPDGTVFGPLICFEDIMPYLSRRAVRNGARLLVNQTNDGWFDGSSGHEQHLANAVFRTVEHRVGMVRAANTGVSAFIDPAGRIVAMEDGDGGRRTEFAGFAGSGVWIRGQDSPSTLYTRFGDWMWAIPCLLLSLLWTALCLRAVRSMA